MLSKKQAGFTLFEVLIAVTIVAIMGALLGAPLMKYLKRGKVTATTTALQTIKNALLLYQSDKGEYPTTQQGLEALVPDYIDSEKKIKDGWKRDFEYNAPPVKFRNKFNHYEVISYGESGVETDATEDSDLVVGY
jgi:general secretion pathway protein G